MCNEVSVAGGITKKALTVECNAFSGIFATTMKTWNIFGFNGD